jgi:hypothetical protein
LVRADFDPVGLIDREASAAAGRLGRTPAAHTGVLAANWVPSSSTAVPSAAQARRVFSRTSTPGKLDPCQDGCSNSLAHPPVDGTAPRPARHCNRCGKAAPEAARPCCLHPGSFRRRVADILRPAAQSLGDTAATLAFRGGRVLLARADQSREVTGAARARTATRPCVLQSAQDRRSSRPATRSRPMTGQVPRRGVRQLMRDPLLVRR